MLFRSMKAWQFNSVAGGLEKNLFLPAAGASKPRITDTQALVEVYSMALNPADYKIPELGLLAKPMLPSPATPGMDFCGRVAEIGAKVNTVRVGDMVFGANVGKLGQGSLAQFTPVDQEKLTILPDGVAVDDAAGAGCVGLTALQSLRPNMKKGDKIFVNGGSGGTGIWTIQIAKALGAHVTTSCSTANVALCKSIGADEVLDYKSKDIVEQLKEKGQIFNLCVDNVGTPEELYNASEFFLVPGAKFVQVGMSSSLASVGRLAKNLLLPAFLGGGKRPYQFAHPTPVADDLKQLGAWLQDGSIKAVTDEVFDFDDAPRAFEKLKTGRAKGKIVVRVKKE